MAITTIKKYDTRFWTAILTMGGDQEGNSHVVRTTGNALAVPRNTLFRLRGRSLQNMDLMPVWLGLARV
jgi:hypothetical protein